jgi:hypothetical protein
MKEEQLMSAARADTLITIGLPPEALASIAETPQAFAREMCLAAAIEWYREGRLSPDTAAEIAGLNQTAFTSVVGSRLSSPESRVGLSVPDSPGEAEIGFASEGAESHYRRLGCLKGRDAAPDAQAESRRFWQESGVAGIRWLIARLRDESLDDRLRGTASLLDDLAPVSLGPILEGLRADPTANQALALLWALGWIGDRHETADPQAELVLVRHLFDEDPELREASARAMRLISPQRAKAWLTRRLRNEPDREVRLTIEDELETLRLTEVEPCIS